MGAYCGGSQKSVSREKGLSRRRSKVERGRGGRGRGTLGWKCPGLTTLPASINPIKVLKNQITCEAFNMNFSLCHGRGCMEEGSRKQQNHPVGMGGPLAHLLQDTHDCVTLGLCWLLLWGALETLPSSFKYLLPSF